MHILALQIPVGSKDKDFVILISFKFDSLDNNIVSDIY